MAGHFSTGRGAVLVSASLLVVRLTLLVIPTTLLLGCALRHPDPDNIMLWIGVAVQGGICLLTFLSHGAWRQPIGSSVITLYLIALAWLWFGKSVEDWYTHMTRAVLLVVPLVFFGLQTL